MLISQSTIATFDRCKRKFWLKHYRQLGRPRDYTSPTTVGSLVHDALEQYYLGAYGDREKFVEPIQFVKERAVGLIGEHIDFAEEIAADAELAGIMVDGYMTWLEETGADSNFASVEPEREIRATLHDGIELIGKLDGKVRTTDGWTGFLENKTVGNFTDLPAYAQINRQLLTYALLEMLEYIDAARANERVLPQADRVSGTVAGAQSPAPVALHLLRPPDHEEGQVGGAPHEPRHDGQPGAEPAGDARGLSLASPQQGREEGAVHGRAPGQSQQGDDGQGQRAEALRDSETQDVGGTESTLGSDESREASRVREEDLARSTELAEGFLSQGAILNMLRKVKRTARAQPPFYARHTVQHNTEELRNHWRHLVGIALEIRRMTELLDAGGDPQLLAPPTPARDCRYSCEFFTICPLVDDGSDVESVIEFEYTHVDPMQRYTEEVEA